jgi:nucleotidyltransferase substrate binding protein (TIGR01987 family)
MKKQDIRWIQRFDNFQKAYQELKEIIELNQVRALSKIEKQGLIQCFEYNHELAWYVMKDYLQEQGFNNIIGSKNATRQAFKEGLIENGEMWMDMIKSRNLTSYAYDKDLAEEIIANIIHNYYPQIADLIDIFSKKLDIEKSNHKFQ